MLFRFQLNHSTSATVHSDNAEAARNVLLDVCRRKFKTPGEYALVFLPPTQNDDTCVTGFTSFPRDDEADEANRGDEG
ncbi:MAG: hypothetical protein QG602_409 [Verrucomicrobiota bacterium]|nr:hypothetical protein [Verrucomicrobiota bacterium]